MVDTPHLHLAPMDAHNELLVQNTHPSDWRNPEPAKMYNLVVVGGGTAGLVSAMGAATLGAKTALVERNFLGGDCLVTGCVPSKSLIRSARVAALARNAEAYGITTTGLEVDFPAVMARLRRLRAHISHHDAAKRFADAGVDVFLGDAKFTGRDTVVVEGETLRFKRAAIATGARAASLPIDGLEAAGYLTNETLFNLTERPRRIAIVGSGPIGCEMAQALARLGCDVSMIEIGDRVLPLEDTDAAAIIEAALKRDGVKFLFKCETQRVNVQDGAKVLDVKVEGERRSVVVDEILVAIGRQPNVENLGLETAGVRYDPKKGIKVNDFLQTSNPAIYAAGDCCMRWKFTHAADAAARILIQNALFSVGGAGRKKLSSVVMPWCTYTDPEVAHVGLYAQEAEDEGVEVDTFTVRLEEVDRAVVESETEGFARVHVEKGKDRIVGATIVAANAGDMISEITVAMVNGVGLGGIGKAIHPYPTQAEVLRKLAGEYERRKLTPSAKKWLARWMAWRR
ncbi:MAG: mercuric reductase [Candidatus Hydrogenedentales bacterium]